MPKLQDKTINNRIMKNPVERYKSEIRTKNVNNISANKQTSLLYNFTIVVSITIERLNEFQAR